MHFTSLKFNLLNAFLLLFISGQSQSQVLKGKITDPKNIPIPFVVVYDETTFSGTTANAEGHYELKLDSGTHSVIFKAMGYYQVLKNIELKDKPVVVDVILKEQPVELKEVVIRPGKEDPAYAIMRKAISMAPYHLNQVKHYTADVYLRGTAHIIKMPKFISKRTVVNGEEGAFKSGDVYIEESVNHITFDAPDTYEQQVKSIRSTFPWNNSEVNPMGLINSSLYEPKVADEFISPLAPTALQHYKYQYEGFFDEGKHVIFKIKVTPKHNSQQLMRGYIFIVDRLWCLHSADVSINMFFGSFNYKTIYSPVKMDAWMPVSYSFFVDAGIMGIKATFKYASSVKFGEVVLNDKVIAPLKEIVETPEKPAVTAPVKKSKAQQEMDKLLAKDELTNRDVMKLSTLMAKEASGDTVRTKSLEIKEEQDHTKVVVDSNAVKNDTTYWNTIRPIPLTAIESTIPPISNATKARSDKDSITVSDTNKKSNKAIGKISRFITEGAGFRLFDSTMHIKYEGLIGLKKIDFNTVDGFLYKQSFAIEQKIDSLHRLKINPGVAYAFSRERLMWWTSISYDYAPMKSGNVKFYIHSLSADYNGESGINSNTNSLASLLFRRNFLKVYHQNLAYIENRVDLANGLNLLAQIGYRTAQPLKNHSDYSFFFRESRDYTANTPGDRDDVLSKNVYNEEAYWDMRLEFTPRHYYRVYGGKKHYQHSDFPTFFIRNRMAVPGIAKSTADYDFLELGMRQQLSWEMMHAFSWSIQAGFFLNRNKIYAMDDKYFNNQNLPFQFTGAKGSFRLLPFYKYANTDKYAEAHVKYTTPYLLFKYLPFLSNKLWVENLHLNYLAGGSGLHYWEAGYSMGQIYMIANIGIFAGFNSDKFRSWGVQLSIDLNQ